MGKIEKIFFFRLFLFYLPEDKIVLFQENSLDLKDFYALNRGDYFVGRFTFPSLEQLPRIWNNFRVSRPVARFREVYFPKICLKRDAIFNSAADSFSGSSEPSTAKNKFPFREVKTFQNEKHRTEGLKPLETRCLNRFPK